MLEKSLVIDLNASRYLACAVIVAACATLSLILVLPLSAWLQFPLLILLFVCFLNVYQHHIAATNSTRIVQLIWENKNQWWLMTQSGQSIKASVDRDSVLWTNMLVLNFNKHENGRRRSLVLLPDSANQEQLRHLRVRLKTQLTQMFEGKT